MDVDEKLLNRYRLALTILRLLQINNNKEGDEVVKSLRKLAASSRTEYSIIQKVTSVKKDPQFTTLAAIIIEGFGISFSEFYSIYDGLSEKDVLDFKSKLDGNKRDGKTEKALARKGKNAKTSAPKNKTNRN